MTTVEALKNLYVALGGDEDDFDGITIIPDAINATATLITGGATKELPAVTSTDNGKVLKVVDGKWAVGEDAIE